MRRAYSNVPSTQQSVSSGTSDEDSNAAPEGTTHAPWRALTRRHRKIRTLDPAKLTSDDYLDFSSKVQPPVRVILQSPDSPSYSTHFCTAEWSARAYPPGTRGFMYYYVPAHSSPLAGELRFRVTPSRDPASFAAGAELLTEHGMPWRYPLYKIVARPRYQPVAALLLQDGLVSQQTLDVVAAALAPLRTIDAGGPPCTLSATPVLSAFGQEFHFRYAVDWNCVCLVAGPDAIVKQRMRCISSFLVRALDGRYVQYSPFEGSLICCFERSTLPEHAGKRVVVIRVKHFVDNDPIQLIPAPDGRLHPIEELRPHEGELLKVMFRGKVRPWAVDVDREWRWKNHRGRALRVLFENEELYGSPRQSHV